MFGDLMAMGLKHGIAGGTGAGLNFLLSERPPTMMETVKYGAVVAGCSFIACRLSAMLVPEFDNKALATISKIATQAAGTGALNIVAMRFADQDLRVEHNAICGAAGGAAGVVGSSFLA